MAFTGAEEIRTAENGAMSSAPAAVMSVFFIPGLLALEAFPPFGMCRTSVPADFPVVTVKALPPCDEVHMSFGKTS
jgi:hypothetical protein